MRDKYIAMNTTYIFLNRHALKNKNILYERSNEYTKGSCCHWPV